MRSQIRGSGRARPVVTLDEHRTLKGKVAFVTGASRGIGEAIAVLLSRHGARTFLVSRSGKDLENVTRSIRSEGGEAGFKAADMTQWKEVERAVSSCLEEYGAPDILVNNAGIFEIVPLHQMTLSQWEKIMDLNLKGVFLCTRAFLPHMYRKGRGEIVNVASVAALQPFEGCAAYCTSKFGLLGFSKVLALEAGPRGIRVITVCPGATNTPLWERIRSQENGHLVAPPPEEMLQPGEVAQAVISVLGEAASSLKGEGVQGSPWGGDLPAGRLPPPLVTLSRDPSGHTLLVLQRS